MDYYSDIELDTNPLKFLGGFCLIFPILMTFLLQLIFQDDWFLQAFSPLIGFGILSAVCLYVYSPMIIINSETIEAKYLFGNYQMYWTDIEKVEMAGGNLALVGTHKRLTLPNFEFWHGPEKKIAKQWVTQKFDELNLTASSSIKALFPVFRNTKVG